jgi:hypothetical protein
LSDAAVGTGQAAATSAPGQPLDDRRATGEVQSDVDHGEPPDGGLGGRQEMAGLGAPKVTVSSANTQSAVPTSPAGSRPLGRSTAMT